MIIDFFKLLLLLLPVSLREGLYDFVQSIGSAISSLYRDYQTWQNDIRLQAATTCQVMYIETMLNYRLLDSFLRVIYITDGDGINVDFVINVPDTVNIDYNRLNALVNKYKLYGKRFSVGQLIFSYEVEWTDMICEVRTVEPIIDNKITAIMSTDMLLSLSAAYAVDSEVMVGLNYGQGVFYGFFYKGDSVANLSYFGYFPNPATIVSVTPTGDSKYNYTF